MIIYPKEYCIFDFETTGLTPEDCKIIEIGALRVKNGKQEQFSWLIKWPGLSVPAKITEITGITDSMIDLFNYTPALAWYEFFEFSRGLPMIGHNIINFDIPFLEAMNAHVNDKNACFDVAELKRNCVDTAALYKAKKLSADRMYNESLYAFCKRVMEIRAFGVKFNVGVCCDELGIDKSAAQQHRAEGDVFLTHEIYKKICLK